MSNSNVGFSTFASKLAELLAAFQAEFACRLAEIKFDLSSDSKDNPTVVITVTKQCLDLKKMKYSSTDFERFCKAENLNGVIFFGSPESCNEVVFSMFPKEETQQNS